MLTKEHLESLLERAISKEVAEACGIETLSEGAIKKNLNTERNLGGDGFAIPYFYNGNICVGDDGVEYVRYRIVDVRLDQDKPAYKTAKYLQRQGAGFMPYVPPIFKFTNKTYLVITEGELKAVSACAHDIPTIAIPGVDMWYDSRDREEGDRLTSNTKVHPVILDIVKKVEAVIVLADSDAKANKNVRKAMSRFCEALRLQANMAVIYKQVPSNVAEEKLGLDDWLAIDAEDAKAFIVRAAKEGVELHDVLTKDGYVALGYQGTDCIIWSRPRKSVVILSASSISIPAVLQSIAGSEWCKIQYGVMTKDEGKVKVEYSEMASDIIDECNSKGFYSQLNTRGAGVWKDRDGMPIINSGTLWRIDGSPCDRVSGSIVYESSMNLGIDPYATPATKAEMTELLECLKTWKWKRPSDAGLMIGWIAHGYLCGALDWRTHANLTGGRGTGKSTLMNMLSKLYGSYAILADGDSTEAGIRQQVGNASRPILIDEGESNGGKVTKILQMLRSASSGSGVLRGTQDQSGLVYMLRACGMVGGIVPPQFNSADASRFIRMELIEQQTGQTRHRLITDDMYAAELGQKFWMRMLQNYDRFNRVLKVMQSVITEKMNSSRAADTIGNVIAASWIALSDSEITPEMAAIYFARFDLEEAVEQQTSNDSVDCLNHILSSVVRTSTGEHTIYSMIANIAKNGKASELYDYLGNYGIKYEGTTTLHSIVVNTQSQHFLKLFQGTRWESGSVKTSLLRIEGSSKADKTMRIGGINCRPINVPIDLELSDTETKYPEAV